VRRVFYALALVIWSALPARADNALISSHDAWKVYAFSDKAEKVCFMVSQPRKQEGKFRKRGAVFLFVTRWPGEDEKNAVSILNGYSFKPDSQVTVTVDGKAFKLFTQGTMAWTKDQAADGAMLEMIQQGASLVVQGVSGHGTETTDTYSLKGSVAAFNAVAQECAKK